MRRSRSLQPDEVRARASRAATIQSNASASYELFHRELAADSAAGADRAHEEYNHGREDSVRPVILWFNGQPNSELVNGYEPVAEAASGAMQGEFDAHGVLIRVHVTLTGTTMNDGVFHIAFEVHQSFLGDVIVELRDGEQVLFEHDVTREDLVAGLALAFEDLGFNPLLRRWTLHLGEVQT